MCVAYKRFWGFDLSAAINSFFAHKTLIQINHYEFFERNLRGSQQIYVFGEKVVKTGIKYKWCEIG